MKKFLACAVFLGLWHVASAQDVVEFDYELDAYYTNVSAFIDLDRDEPVEDASELSEGELYTDLIANTFKPNVFLVEAAVHPMPLAGAYYRHNYEKEYERAEMQELNLNLIRAVTAGFEEPYSLSFFVGRMLVFKNKENSRIGKNRAYIGYLATVGDYSIKENIAHYDKWVNFEFKLKGTRENDDRELDWSFRIGTRLHENKDFVNTYYVAARRSSVDFNEDLWSLIYNSAFSSKLEFSAQNSKLTEAEFMVEKKWPIKWNTRWSFGLGVGYLYYSGEKYRGELREEGVENHQLILRPNLKW
ncbi:MAG: hypothetical protein PHI89_05295 [Thiovulaceae bacterium]|nr:hypothetical protein [Sulfurimonadaceae bacterium]